MRVTLETSWAPKHGSSAEEYEDAFSPSSGATFEGARLRFAVADGATEAAFSRLWARLLVEGYRKRWIGGRDPETRRGLERLARIWWRRVGRKPLPWYGEQKRDLGSFAALLGLELSAPEGGEAGPLASGSAGARLKAGLSADGHGTWRSYSVGDCCLFHLRGDHLLGSFPIEAPEDFGSRPVLLSSNMARNGGALASAATAWGEWAAGDEFYLLSDALACWFLAEHRAGDPPWHLARDLGHDDREADFRGLISHLRGQCGLRNDDVTLLRIVPVPERYAPDPSGPC